MTSLAQRIATALVLMPAVVALVLLLETDVFRWVLVIVPLAGAWEWGRMCGIGEPRKVALYVGVVAASYLVAGALEASGAALWLAWPATAFWLAMTVIFGMRRSRAVMPAARAGIPVLVAGPLLAGVAWVSLVAVHRMVPDGQLNTLFLLVLIWVADSAAYFTGRAFGRHKLAPAISPGKTIEGVAGALAGAMIVAGLFAAVAQPSLPFAGFLFLCLLATVVSVTGDLFESLVKRRHGVKDSGQLLPGHGGVLDRIDSISAAAPVFYVGLTLLEYA